MASSVFKCSGQKLRHSCDSCGVAKVKCDRERPSCGRCKILSSTCVYGPSRKCGKPPRARLSPSSGRIQKRISKPLDRSGEVAGPQSIGISDVGEPTRNDISNPPSDGMHLANQNPGVEAQNQMMGFFEPFPFDQFGAWPMGNLPMDFNFIPPASESTAPMSKDSHSCPRESYEIFRDLICPSPFLHAPESNSSIVVAPLDEVLQFTKTAIDRLSRVLNCDCAKSGHRAMVHASIVSRILIWYQQAAGWTSSSAEGHPPTESRSSDSESCAESTSKSPPASYDTDSASLTRTTGFAVDHVPLSLGVFMIEDENVQAEFRNQLVMSELKRTAGLIDLFMAPDLAETVGGLYLHLGTWLKTEYERTVDILKRGSEY